MSLHARPSIFHTSLLALCIAAPLAVVGCSAAPEAASPEASEEQMAETQDELTASASTLVGTYWTHQAATGGFARLDLKADGTYSASVDAPDVADCATPVCLFPESGKWNASKKSGGGYRLRLRPTGETSRWFDATTAATGPAALSLSRAGAIQNLYKLAPDACLENTDCASTEVCGPKFCLMYCAESDPFCCGPSTCQTQTPPPPPASCTGAWLDEAGGCRSPNDGVYPASCCAALGKPCGPVTGPTPPPACGPGLVCCNKVAGICAKPGEACVQ
jgi:hypothetical protein